MTKNDDDIDEEEQELPGDGMGGMGGTDGIDDINDTDDKYEEGEQNV